MPINRFASILAATLILFAAFTGVQNFSPNSLTLDLSPFHREAAPSFHADTYNPAAPPQFQTNNALRQPIDRHPRHRAL